MGAAKAFFDTNVLLYMYGGDEDKRSKAKDIFQQHASSGSLAISTQVIQEFYVAGSRMLGIPPTKLRDLVSALLDLPLVIIGPPQITLAIRTEELHNISFWDALIVEAAKSAHCDVLYTEDLNDGQDYGSVVARNPFRDR